MFALIEIGETMNEGYEQWLAVCTTVAIAQSLSPFAVEWILENGIYRGEVNKSARWGFVFRIEIRPVPIDTLLR